MKNLFNSTKVDLINNFIKVVNDGDIKLTFKVTRRSVDSPYRGCISITNIQADNYKSVTEFFTYMGIPHTLRQQSKDKWKKLIYSNSLLDTLYHMDVFHQWITTSMKKDQRLKSLVETIMVKQEESKMVEVCEDLPF